MKKFIFSLFFSVLSIASQLQGATSTELDTWRAEEYFQNSSSQREAANDLLKYVSFQENACVLDVGCGDGKITAAIASKTPDGTVLGLDFSLPMIDFASKTFPTNQYPNLSFVLGNAESLTFNDQFDIVLSLTALQFIQDHNAFVAGAYNSLKPSGVLALTMPLGLPATLKQAVTELASSATWYSYFSGFSSGWKFVGPVEYGALLENNGFVATRLSVVPQRDIFPSRAIFQGFISQWFPYLRALPDDLKQPFMSAVIDRFLELETPFPNGEVHFKIRRLEVVAVKG